MRGPLRTVMTAAVSGSAARALNTISGVITLPVILIHLGPVEYGVWIMVGQLSQMLVLSDLGVGNAMGRMVARVRGAGSERDLVRVLRAGACLLSAAGALVAMIVLLVAGSVPGWLRLPEHLHPISAYVFLVTGLGVSVTLPLGMVQGLLAGLQRYVAIDRARVVGTLLYFWAVVLLGWGELLTLTSLVWVVLVTTLVPLLLMAWEVRGLIVMGIPRDDASDSGWLPVREVRELVDLGSSTLLVTLSGLGYRQGLAVAVGVAGGPAAAGVYGVALNVMTQVSGLLTQLPRSLVTVASELQARGDLRRLRESALVVMAISILLGIYTFVGVYLFAEPVLTLLLFRSAWSGDEFRVISGALMVMSFGLLVGLPQISSRLILQGTGAHWQVAGRFALTSLGCVLCGVWAMQYLDPSQSAAWAWAAVFTIQGIWLYPPLLSRFLDLGFGRSILYSYLPAALTSLPGTVVLLLTAGYFMEMGLAGFVLAVFLGVGLCAISCLILLRWIRTSGGGERGGKWA
ncbi:MAG: oligosaccharide flippase family protein [Gemmatimonadota bacterium]